MKIDDALLQKLEKLSSLKISDEKREGVITQLSEIVSFVEILNELDLTHEEATFTTVAGGTPLRECNVVEMKKNGRVVLLTASPETIFDRVKDSHDRPVIENNKNVPFIADLMEKRRAKYEAAADIIINTDGKSLIEVCEELVQQLLAMDENK